MAEVKVSVEVPVPYSAAPIVAMELIQGLKPSAFFDKIQGQNSLNFKGISLLAGIMGCHIIEIEETDETDAKQLVMKAVAVNPQGHKGYGWISRPKQDKREEEDEDFRERSYTHVKRNALRDLVPYQVFLEMLVREHETKGKQTAPQQAAPVQQQSNQAKELQNAQAGARQALEKERDSLMSLWGLSPPDLIEHVEDCVGKPQHQWDIAAYKMLIEVAKDPVGMGVDQAVEISEQSKSALPKPEENTKNEEVGQDLFSVPESEESSEETPEASSDPDAGLQQLMSDIG